MIPAREERQQMCRQASTRSQIAIDAVENGCSLDESLVGSIAQVTHATQVIAVKLYHRIIAVKSLLQMEEAICI